MYKSERTQHIAFDLLITFEDMSKRLFYFFFLSLLSFLLFYNLDHFSIRMWDESRVVQSAYEMFVTKEWIVVTFEGMPEMWSTKPPMFLWVECLSMGIFRVTEFAVRFPSALSALLTCMALISFGKKQLGSSKVGYLAAFVLATSSGYVCTHVSRTGDYESLLILFTTGFSMLMYRYVEKPSRWLMLAFFGCLLGAVLTKSIQGLIFLPGLGLYILSERKLKTILKDPFFYLGAVLFVAGVASYYLRRESLNPGYLQAVWENELGGRFTKAQEEHNGPFTYYFERLSSNFLTWIIFLPLGIIGFKSSSEGIRKATKFSLLMAFPYLLILSMSVTKLEWYLAPSLPFLAMFVGIGIHETILRLADRYPRFGAFTLKPFGYIGICVLIGVYPYFDQAKRICRTEEYPWDKEAFAMGYYLRDHAKSGEPLPYENLCYDGYFPQLRFPASMCEERGWRVNFKFKEQLNAGDTILVSQTSAKAYIRAHYIVEETRMSEEISVFRVLSTN